MTTTTGEIGFLGGGGGMGALIRAHAWGDTPLGPPGGWPQPLKTAVGILINSGYPMYLAWGPEFIQIYNDAYLSILGDKHPASLGAGTAATFAEIWDTIGPMFRTVIETGQASTFSDLLLPLSRRGFLEECYFVFSYSPIMMPNGVASGVFVAALETTDRVLRERRQKVLRELTSIPTHDGREAVLQKALGILAAAPEDAPGILIEIPATEHLAAISLCNGLTAQCLREGLSAKPADASLEPAPLTVPFVAPWWPEPVRALTRVPIPVPGLTGDAGHMVFALSPRLAFDAEYRDWMLAVAANIGARLADSEALETERRRAEGFAQIDAAKTVFFSNVSHEFRTPLALMLAPLQTLIEQAEAAPQYGLAAVPGSEARELLAVAHRNALRLLKLVNALLDFSRIEAGRVKAAFQPTDLATLTSDLASNFRSTTQAAGLQLIVDCPPLDEPVFVDRDMWETIVLNLISNAFKFTFEGELAVQLTRSGDAAELVVRDTGVGIPAAELPRLFERFHRVEATRGRSFEGTGIGLALVEELVRLHGGAIEAQSRVGEGTAFTVRVPLGFKHLPPQQVSAETRAASVEERARPFIEEAMRWLPPSAPQENTRAAEMLDDLAADRREDLAQDLPRQAERILLADDNPDMRAYLSRLLRSQGYLVESVADGVAAVAAARREPPMLMISDVMMPGLSGVEVLQALRSAEETREIPVLLLSARAGEEAKIEGLAAGADDYLVKPFSARELLARVSSALRLAQARREISDARRSEVTRTLRLFDAAPGFMCVLAGPRHTYAFANEGYRQLTGRHDLIGRDVVDVLPEVVEQEFIRLLDGVYTSGERFIGEGVPLELQHDGGTRRHYIDFIYEPVKGDAGETTGIFVLGMEVTDRVLAGERQRVLVNELNHRVKNTLATVQSITWQSLRNARTIDEARRQIDDRLISLAHAHDLLTAEHWSGAGLADVVKRALEPFRPDSGTGAGGQITLAGPNPRLTPSQSLALSLALHELATNAVKYGALSTTAGRVDVEWRVKTPRRVAFEWRERGGPPVERPKRAGFGTRLIERGVAVDLDGAVTLSFEATGVVCAMEISLEAGSPGGALVPPLGAG